ncbi:hypothetical protein HID58_059397 [Brassica napus]|uniref:Uncharacterized protein n=1 Tax=Brassica napus TaxID=3708 RepID=A0ABQ7ZSV1_BRANA|nr:hypothetical protein HID58_059397 [Brassica napus]
MNIYVTIKYEDYRGLKTIKYVFYGAFAHVFQDLWNSTDAYFWQMIGEKPDNVPEIDALKKK